MVVHGGGGGGEWEGEEREAPGRKEREIEVCYRAEARGEVVEEVSDIPTEG